MSIRDSYKPAETSAEGGVVISSADGIVHVEGMNRAVYGEIVTFDNGAKGMVESVDPEQLGIMLFDGAETVGVGDVYKRQVMFSMNLFIRRHRPFPQPAFPPPSGGHLPAYQR